MSSWIRWWPLEKSYQLFESLVSSFKTQLQEKKEEHVEETSILLRNQYTTFSVAHNVLKEHMEESTVKEEVIRNWFTYYGQVFQHVRDMCVLIKSLHDRRGDIESMEKEIQDHLVLEMEKLDKLEKKEHHWISQAYLGLDICTWNDYLTLSRKKHNS